MDTQAVVDAMRWQIQAEEDAAIFAALDAIGRPVVCASCGSEVRDDLEPSCPYCLASQVIEL